MFDHCALKTILIGLLSSAVAGAAMAAELPPIKTGLWQITSERKLNGQAMPDPMEHLKNLPPDMRAKMEAMMKKNGVDLSGGTIKSCIDKATLDQGHWRNQQGGNCKTTYSQQSASLWKWHSSCTKPKPAEIDGESRFIDPQHYTTIMKMTSSDHVMDMTVDARWLGADCGDVAPIKAPQE